jgi:hypothetical protein
VDFQIRQRKNLNLRASLLASISFLSAVLLFDGLLWITDILNGRMVKTWLMLSDIATLSV